MFAGPIIAREVLTAPRPLRFYVARASYASVLFVLMWTTWQVLVAQATEFDDDFHMFALLVLPVALFIGVATYVRVIDARLEDFWLVSGMNRLRDAYLEIAPELEPYFVTATTTISDLVSAVRQSCRTSV